MLGDIISAAVRNPLSWFRRFDHYAAGRSRGYFAHYFHSAASATQRVDAPEPVEPPAVAAFVPAADLVFAVAVPAFAAVVADVVLVVAAVFVAVAAGAAPVVVVAFPATESQERA